MYSLRPQSSLLSTATACRRSAHTAMNRQQRPQQNRRSQGPHRRDAPFGSNVPSVQQVAAGARVSIVLKADQPTGREVQGVVQDLLTRGNHPRGIKVRLQDGRIGRVQRMVSSPPAAASLEPQPYQPSGSRTHKDMEPRDDHEQDQRMPPPRTLADFLPSEPQQPTEDAPQMEVPQPSMTVKCPFCDTFEGDEVAVSHHVEEHLT